MSDIKISEVFCEVLSGAAMLLVAGLGLHYLGFLKVQDLPKAIENSSFGKLAEVLAICYLLGLIMDAISLAIGELFLDKRVVSDEPKPEEVRVFLKTAPEHILKYRDTQWAYYSTYRNLFLLLFPGGILATLIIFQERGIWGLLVLAISVAFGIAFFRSMKTLLKLYYNLTCTFTTDE